MTIEWVVKKYSTYLKTSSGLVEFQVSEKMAPEEFLNFRKIFTPAYTPYL